MYHSLCDIYLEASKKALSDPSEPAFVETLATLHLAITTGLKLLHPLMPFLTEELYQRLQHDFQQGQTVSSILNETYPEYDEWERWENVEVDTDIEHCMEIVNSVRSVKALYSLKRKQLPQVVIVPASSSEGLLDGLQRSKHLIERLVPCGRVSIQRPSESQVDLKQWSVQKLAHFKVYVEIANHIDVSLELQKLSEKISKLKSRRQKLQAKRSTSSCSENSHQSQGFLHEQRPRLRS